MFPQLPEIKRDRGILLDTNLLILYLVGITNRNRIGRYKRTQSYTEGDFDRLVSLLSRSDVFVTTPHVLTQVSDLVKLDAPEFELFLELFGKWVGETSEHVTPAAELVRHPIFPRVGLADAGIGSVAEQGTVVVTDDFDLYLALLERELPVINFNHLRSQFTTSEE